MRQRLQRWKIYSLTLLGSENSDRAKDTWCSSHYLNTVHEEAGDGCAHEKLKAVIFRQRCRDTSLQASSGGTRTSPRTEAWSAMQAGFFSRSSSELLLEVANETKGQLARRGAEQTMKMGWWRVGQN
jgi:hypothetical protein